MPRGDLIRPGFAEHHAAVSVAAANAEVTLHAPDTLVYDPDTYTKTPTAGAVLWTGLVRIQRIGEPSLTEVAGQVVAIRRWLVVVPLSAPVTPQQGQVFRVINSTDATVSKLVVEGAIGGSIRIERDFECVDQMEPELWTTA